MRTRAIAAAGVAVLALASCGGADLSDSDPAGHAACSAWMVNEFEGASSKDRTVIVAGTLMEAGESAQNSRTPAIADAVSDEIDLPGVVMADGDELTAACEASGYEIARHSAAWWNAQPA